MTKLRKSKYCKSLSPVVGDEILIFVFFPESATWQNHLSVIVMIDSLYKKIGVKTSYKKESLKKTEVIHIKVIDLLVSVNIPPYCIKKKLIQKYLVEEAW